MARRRTEETLLRIEKRKNKLKLAQLGQDEIAEAGGGSRQRTE